MPLSNKDIADGCAVSKARYDALSLTGAKLEFACDLQGFTASMVDRGYTLAEALVSIMELMRPLRKANAS